MDMTITKLTNYNFDDFDLDFQGSDIKQVDISVISLECLLHHNNTVNYYAVWNSIEEKLMNFVVFVGQYYKYDDESLYNILVKHVGTSGPGPNTIVNNDNYRN